ncbi:hydroxysqualene dehydroxylase [Actinacidiphila glaucinigra]|uniref:NAD-binding domain and a Fe-S cluster-containing protein n=1 Tax=Actinacidiphila glaucinigra TaxID=235986 RepID=A0A239FZ55_9ACTN|nr:FAD-dependent oxidoreductase [Actinacidiphila glaucinigra]SNS61054.1 NAD-binding domain and a Fe-S cluster-containing protein [Actinacidiphila glaucinigra]
MTVDGRTRRRFLAGAGGVAAGAVAVRAGVSGVARAATGAKRVAVLGGGVSGLSAAHELAERGYAVTVYEYHTALGGKARSMDVPGTGGGGRRALPGEHGFRFFPGFYRNLPDTLRRIPVPGNPGGVHDNLRSGTEALFARAGGRADLHFPLRRVTTPPRPGDLTPAWIRDQVLSALGLVARLPAHEAAYFADRVLVHLTSCDARREGQWEKVPWWDFIRAGEMSEEYRLFFGIGQTRNLVATRAEEASTRTVGRVIIEALLLWGLLGRGQDGDVDRVLNAPTSEAWIDPWEAHLRALGVEFVLGTEVREVLYGDGRITGVRVGAPDGTANRTVTADHYVSALPVEHARPTWGQALRAADPQLGRCDRLRTDWMVGVQFYLARPTPLVNGHVNCLDSPWSVTAVGQAQFWDGRDFAADYGDGRAADCVSAIVSEWDKPGILYGKPARRCTREEIVAETWAQLKDAVGTTGQGVLDDSDLLSWFMDPAVTGLGGPHPSNREQLLIHPAGTLYHRPSAATAVPNFFLAGDYVRTDVDLATMEGANESARRAVNALLDADGSDADRCRVVPLYRPPEMEALKKVDELRYRLGLPNTFDLG